MTTDGVRTEAVHIRVLGAFEVWREAAAAPAEWPGRRSAELVQLLALAPGQRLLRDQVIDALWPHLDADAGAANLRKAAHHARRALGDPDAVVLHSGQVHLFPGHSVTTDALHFEQLADRALATGSIDTGREAVAAYRGELLPSARYEEWANGPRQRLYDRYLAVLRLVGDWERIAELEPTDEHAVCEAMRAALAAGNLHAAITRYGRLRTALARELGVLPSAQTEELYAACGAEVAGTAPLYVGRVAELTAIGSVLRRREQATRAVFAVHGPPGMGKSALCQEVTRLGAAHGWRVLSSTAADAAHAYAVLAALVEQVVLHDRGVVDAATPKTRAVLAELSPLFAPASPLEMPLTRHQVIGAVQQLLDLAGHIPTLVVVDDAHLADDASVEAVLRLGDSGSRSVVVVCAYRLEAASETLRHTVARLTRAGAAQEVALQPLSRAEVDELAAASGLRLPTATLDDIAARSEGNPFFVLELALAAGTPNAGTPNAGTAQPGTSLADAVTARFVDLDDGHRALLRRLALVGGDLDLVSVLALTGADDEEGARLLDAALAAGVLVVDSGRYRFRHDLVRTALAEQMPPHQRVAVHRDAARRLAEAGAPPSLVARHWLDGGRPADAAPWLVAAANDALRLASYTTAVSQTDLLLAHQPTHAEALLIRAKALDALGDPRALAAYAAAAQAAGEQAAREIRPLQALAQIKQGDPAGALVTLAGPEPTTLEARVAHALTLSGAAALGFGDPAIGTEKAAEVRRLAFESGDTSAIVVASWAHAAAAHARGDLRASLRADLLDTSSLAKLAVNVFDGQLCFAQRLLYGARPYPEVIAFMDAFAAEASRLGAARGVAFAVTLRGEARLLAGQLEEADDDLVEGCRLHHALGGPTGESFSIQRRAEVAMARGRHAEARVLLDDALAVARESDIGFHLFDRIYGTYLMLASDPDTARAALDEAEDSVRGPVETCPGCHITFAFPAALAAARAGDVARLEQYEQACTFLADIVMRLPAWYAALDEVRGHRCLLHGDRVGARAHLAAALAGFVAVGQPLDVARSRAALDAIST